MQILVQAFSRGELDEEFIHVKNKQGGGGCELFSASNLIHSMVTQIVLLVSRYGTRKAGELCNRSLLAQSMGNGSRAALHASSATLSRVSLVLVTLYS